MWSSDDDAGGWDDESNSAGGDGALGVDDLLPAVLRRPVIANHVVHERVQVDTADHEDHTFCGVMFDVRCTDTLPVEWLEISSVAVRGALGPMTVWTTPDTYQGKQRSKSSWTRIYEREHEVSHRRLVPLELGEASIKLPAGGSCGLFVHSARPGDSAVVYDNNRQSRQPRSDELLTILPGLAALDNRPFGEAGLWGEGWRARRTFVGRISVGVCWRLWNPECHQAFPLSFRRAVRCLLLCAGRQESPLHAFSDAVVFYVLNMCRWDWFETQATVEDIIVEGTNLPLRRRVPPSSSSDSEFSLLMGDDDDED